MNPDVDFERQLRRHYREQGQPRSSATLVQSVIDATATVRQRPRWLVVLRSPLMTTTSLAEARASNVRPLLLLAILVLLAAILGAAYIGSQHRPIVRPNGEIAYGLFDPTVSGDRIWVNNPDGTQPRLVFPGLGESPRWSPLGDRISVAASPAGAETQVLPAIVNPDGSGYRLVRPASKTLNLGCAAWSPEGTYLYCEGWDDANPAATGLYRIRLADGATDQLTQPTTGHDIPSDVSPDGTRILFGRESAPGGPCTTMMIANIDGSSAHTFTDVAACGGRWSPDGTSIVTTSGAVAGSTDVSSTVSIIDIPTGAAHALPLSGPAVGPVAGAAWSPDGTRILFAMSTAGRSLELWSARRDGSGLVQLTFDSNDDLWPDWGVHPGCSGDSCIAGVAVPSQGN